MPCSVVFNRKCPFFAPWGTNPNGCDGRDLTFVLIVLRALAGRCDRAMCWAESTWTLRSEIGAFLYLYNAPISKFRSRKNYK
jgi:hypothetical protein